MRRRTFSCEGPAPEDRAIPAHAPPAADCRVVVRRQGLLAPVGHDLELSVTVLEVDIAEDASRVRARFDARSLHVLASLDGDRRDPTAPPPHDRAAIERDVGGQVLEAQRYPDIVFESRSVRPVGDGFEVRGALALHGRARELQVTVRRTGDRLVAEVVLDQRDFGIRPFSALLGALRVRPEVTVTLSVPAG